MALSVILFGMSVSAPVARDTDAPVARAGVDAPRALALARKVLATEASAIAGLADRLGEPFVAAVSLIMNCRGRVVVSGIGKSGHIARKLAATLASTGTPAFFVHPAEASHGDLGMITPDDVVLMLSNSGETDELVLLTPHLRRQGAAIIALTGNEGSSLAQSANVHLDAGVDAEACPLGLAPTASTTAALALGDCLALALLDARGFSVEDFARAHPGGSLGRRLLTRVGDVMRSGNALPVVGIDATLGEAVVEMTGKGMGMTAVVDGDRRVAGVFTDGDLRRCLDRIRDVKAVKVADVMTNTPRTITADRLAIDCVDLMETTPKVTVLLVVDGDGRLAGALHLHDLFRARVL
jgi:arabinose-5-phosphate isomerase